MENIFRVHLFIMFGWQNMIHIIVSIKKNIKKKSSIIFAKVLFLLLSKDVIEIIKKLLYRKRDLDFNISQKHVETPFPDKTRLDDVIRRIKEIISFTLILHSAVCDSGLLLLRKKTHLWWPMNTKYFIQIATKNGAFL